MDESSVDDAERSLFVILEDGGQVARYSDGEWWVEYPHAALIPGRRIKVDSAVHLALRPGSVVRSDQPGGRIFYDRLSKARAILRAD